jgi:hypothetical protein
MRTQEALRKIRTQRPTSLKEFKTLGLLGRYIASGVFRESFRIKGTNLIVKFPLNESESDKKPEYRSGIAHTRTEMRRLKKLMRIRALRSHLPKVWYYDQSHGVVVMTYYANFDGYDACDKIELLGKVINKLMRQYAHTAMNDIQGDNTRMAGGKNKRLIFVDLGY